MCLAYMYQRSCMGYCAGGGISVHTRHNYLVPLIYLVPTVTLYCSFQISRAQCAMVACHCGVDFLTGISRSLEGSWILCSVLSLVDTTTLLLLLVIQRYRFQSIDLFLLSFILWSLLLVCYPLSSFWQLNYSFESSVRCWSWSQEGCGLSWRRWKSEEQIESNGGKLMIRYC